MASPQSASSRVSRRHAGVPITSLGVERAGQGRRTAPCEGSILEAARAIGRGRGPSSRDMASRGPTMRFR